MGRARKLIPSLCHHKGRQLGYVTVAGRQVYFKGRWPAGRRQPPSAVADQYQRWCARRLAEIDAAGPSLPVAAGDPSLDELWLAYHAFCATEYRKHGELTSEYWCVKNACRVAARLYGEEPAADFGPRKLEVVRAEFVRLGWERRYINQQIQRVRRMFSWGVRRELVPEATWRQLLHVPGLRKGKTEAPERRDVKPVDWAAVEKTLAKLTPLQRAMVRVHRLTGCRAAEVCVMRPCDVDQAADPWRWVPYTAKTEHLDEVPAVRYWIGPAAQKILKPLLKKATADGWMFPTRRPGGSRTGRYTPNGYRQFIVKACELAGVPRWSPRQIRHTRLTEIRALSWEGHTGLEAANAIAGHADLATTAIYAAKKDALAQLVVSRIG